MRDRPKWTQDAEGAPVDWRTRREGGVVDFRLPGETGPLELATLRQRIGEYIRLRNAERTGRLRPI